MVKDPAANTGYIQDMQVTCKTQVQFLGQEDPLEEGTATHSSILVWRIPWTEDPGGLWSMGLQRIEHDGCDLVRYANWTEM